LDDLDFDNLDDLDDLDNLEDFDDFEEADEGIEELDLVDEADQPDSNEMLLFNYLSSIGKRKHNIGLNIRAGDTVFQFARDTDYSQIKKKELQELVENKLHSVYGEIPSTDQYSYFVRPDGSLAITSIDREPASLTLVNKVNDLYRSSILYIRDIMPDEVALTGLYRQNYPVLDDKKITALVKFGSKRCRIIFFRGHVVEQVSPVIHEGTGDKGFLSTVFSKILFQLDTGEVPGLDRIILCDNTVGMEAVEFFQRNFPDLEVREFQLNQDIYDINEPDLPKITAFTTAIAIAIGASGLAKDVYPDLSIVPRYVQERQKIFQLQWHGMILLIAIGLSPILLNHFYQQYAEEINHLESETNRVSNMITEIEPIVRETEMLEEMLAMYQGQLVLMEELSDDNIRWTGSFDKFNQSVQDIGGLWITTFRQASDGLEIQGVSLNESRIPALARQFGHVTLLNVTKEEVRERDIFTFTMRINRVVADESLYTPEESREIMEFLESFN
jgi:Tfp pilus assembly protein PilN